MPPLRRAVIDIGTNSVKLLVAEVEGRSVTPLLERSHQTRLGRGFYQDHRLQPEAIDDTARAVAEFVAQARAWSPELTRVIATSATRDAVNQRELLDAIQHASGATVEVISGEREAEWAFHGVTSDPALAGRPLLILDIGGGSTEFILGVAEHVAFCESFPCGSVRLLEQFAVADPPTQDNWTRCHDWLRQFLQERVTPELAPALKKLAAGSVQLVGTGGTTSILARMELALTTFDRDLIEAKRLNLQVVRRQRERLWSLPVADRKQLIGLPPNRADVILMGVAICEAVIEGFGFPDIQTSTRGLRFGALMQPRSHD
ncbi:MAG: Ppx/GppA family phosphatase [Verrucomicrobia bacterium]|nr:Ppx/GppA family phosphatase [Verrucomicrobiota bacterium]